MESKKCQQHYYSSLLLLTMSVVVGGDYGDSVSCTDFPDVANLSVSDLQQEVESFGECVRYTDSRQSFCSRFYSTDVSTYYLPSGRQELNIHSVQRAFGLLGLSTECEEPIFRAVCYYYYPPCGNSTHFEPPNALCQDTCQAVANGICQEAWNGIKDFIETIMRISPINCNDPGSAIDPLPHCCSDAGIVISEHITVTPTRSITSTTTGSTTTSTADATVPGSTSEAPGSTVVIYSTRGIAASPVATPGTTEPLFSASQAPNNMVTIIALSVTVGLVAALCVCITMVTVVFYHGVKNYQKSQLDLPQFFITSPRNSKSSIRYVPPTVKGISDSTSGLPRVSSGCIREMAESNMLIPGRHLQLLETIGQGEFGVVYRGHLTGWQDRITAELVAVKSLKNCFTLKDVDQLMKEAEKMMRFNHYNVLNLIGVCIDAGEVPYIVMPFMANGDLLTYLKKERHIFTIAEGAGENSIEDAKRKLLSICLQIANGMSYLAEEKFVHRDLAARNCMIDEHFVIKVADFGLSEDIYSRNYFRQVQGEEESAIKLPIKWMALESLLDEVFTEKTDVWSYGVTCWEVFSLGHSPYPGIDPFSLIKLLKSGERLEKPTNAACTPQVYDVVMRRCWNEAPESRLSFKDLVLAINTLLEEVACYLDVIAFSKNKQNEEKT